MTHSFLCPNCGLRVNVPEGYERPKIRCTECGVISEVPTSARKTDPAPRRARATPDRPKHADPVPAAPPRPPSDVVPKLTVPAVPPSPTYASVYIWGTNDDEEGSDPYPVADPARPRCPRCAAELEFGAVLCLRCGFDQREGRRRVREYVPLVCRWDAGMTAGRRAALFLAGQAGTALFGLVGAWLLGDFVAFVAPWLMFTALTAFLLGTYDRLDLTRDRKGRVELTRTWHVCFVRRPPARIDLRQFEGLSTGKGFEAGFFEWLVFLSLLPSVIPALIWWWVAIRSATVTVALTRDHGYAAEILYRGWDEEHALDLAATLADAARLSYKPG